MARTYQFTFSDILFTVILISVSQWHFHDVVNDISANQETVVEIVSFLKRTVPKTSSSLRDTKTSSTTMANTSPLPKSRLGHTVESEVTTHSKL